MVSNYDKSKYKEYAADFLRSHFGVETGRNFRCINPTHYDTNPSMGYHSESHTARCFSCGARYDIFALAGLHYGLDNFIDQYKKVEEIYGGGSSKTYTAPKIHTVDFTAKINEYHSAVGKTDYYLKRGLTQETIDKYKLGYNETSTHPYTIPVTKSYYFSRAKDPNAERKTLNPTGGKVEILNKQHLFSEGIVFVTEGWADAMSIEQLGFKAISTNGAGNHNLVLKHKDYITAKLVILADPDKAGKLLTKNLTEGLTTEYCVDHLPSEYHDPNDMLKADPNGLKAFLEKPRTFGKTKLKGFVDIEALTEDTIISEEVAKYYGSVKDHIEKTKVKAQLMKKAKDFKMTTLVNNFLKPYEKEQSAAVDETLSIPMPLNLRTEDWTITDNGVFRKNGKNIDKACSHPICITKILHNQDTGKQKKELSYYIRNGWHTYIVNSSDIAETKSIIQLADKGIRVNCTNAKLLVEFLADIENLNIEIIPYRQSVSKLGWTSRKDFSPYCDSEFDGEQGCKAIFEAMTPIGEFKESLGVVNQIRGNDVARLLVAASLVSPLLYILKMPTFFVHIWGQSGIGKSNALKIVTSMWGNYETMMRSMNSTTVGLEKLAGFYNNVPLPLDELQSMKDTDALQNVIYMLSNGNSRNRSNKQGGIDAQEFWCNTILTTGEEPLTNDFSNAGAKNRTIEIEMESPLFAEQVYGEIMPKALDNYGHIGKEFTDMIKKTKVEVLQAESKVINKKCMELGLKGKQLVCATSIALGDYMFETRLMGVDQEEAVKRAGELINRNRQFFPSDDEIQIGNRAYEFLLGWITTHDTKFTGEATFAERFGKYDDNKEHAFIVQAKMNSVLKDAGFNPRAVVKDLVRQGLIIKNPGRDEFSIPCRINSVTTACYKLALKRKEPPKVEPKQMTLTEMTPIEDADLPF